MVHLQDMAMGEGKIDHTYLGLCDHYHMDLLALHKLLIFTIQLWFQQAFFLIL
jgi:hypothetical protein